MNQVSPESDIVEISVDDLDLTEVINSIQSFYQNINDRNLHLISTMVFTFPDFQTRNSAWPIIGPAIPKWLNRVRCGLGDSFFTAEPKIALAVYSEFVYDPEALNKEDRIQIRVHFVTHPANLINNASESGQLFLQDLGFRADFIC